MTLRIAVDCLTFYKSLPSSIDKEKKLELVESFVKYWMDGQFESALIRKIYSIPILHKLLRKMWFSSANKIDEKDGWYFKYYPKNDDLFYGVDVERCGLVKFMDEQGYPELSPIMCKGDFYISKYLPKNIHFERKGVIAEGFPVCDFRYFFRSNQAPL